MAEKSTQHETRIVFAWTNLKKENFKNKNKQTKQIKIIKQEPKTMIDFYPPTNRQGKGRLL